MQRLNKVVNQYFKEKNDALLGKCVPVLTEGLSNKKNNYFGYTDTNKLVNFTGENVEIGSIVLVEITESKTWSLDGRVKE